jgi:hypothetical protein
VLDPKTRELVEEPFSEEMRDTALTVFNLDASSFFWTYETTFHLNSSFTPGAV